MTERLWVAGFPKSKPCPGFQLAGTGLENRGSSCRIARISKLEPPNCTVSGRARTAGGRPIGDKRLLNGTAAEVAISQAIHVMERKVIEVVRGDGR